MQGDSALQERPPRLFIKTNHSPTKEMSFYTSVVRPLLFLLPAERVRNISLGALGLFGHTRLGEWLLAHVYGYRNPSLEREVFGVRFRNPIGAAAGIDRDGKLYRQLGALGFGFVEIGTITPKEQQGGIRPRMFRLPRQKALLHRMGHPNCGIEKAIDHLRRRAHGKRVVVGANIAPNNHFARENAAKEYLRTFRPLYQYVEYFTVNISSIVTSPENYTPEDKALVEEILEAMFDFRRGQNDYRPILLKLSPDWDTRQVDDMVKILVDTPLDGLVVSDCSTQWQGATRERERGRMAGCTMGGAPLIDRTEEMVRYVCSKMDFSYPVIAVGGVMSAADAQRLLDAGASLVQCYSAMVYHGPAFPGRTCKALAEAAKTKNK